MRNTALPPRRLAAFVIRPVAGMPAEVFVGVSVGCVHGGRARNPVSAGASGSVVGTSAGVAAVQLCGTDKPPTGAARPTLASTDREGSGDHVGAVATAP